MRDPIASLDEVINTAKHFIQEQKPLTAHNLKQHFKGGQIVRYQNIIDEFLASEAGKEFVEKYDRSEKLPLELVEFVEQHTARISSEMSNFAMVAVNYFAKEREQVRKVYRDEAKQLEQENKRLIESLKEEIKELGSKRLVDEAKMQKNVDAICSLEENLVKVENEKAVLLKILSTLDKKGQFVDESNISSQFYSSPPSMD